MKSNPKELKIGTRVKILSKICGLENRKNKNGRIKNIDGGYIYVRPMYKKYEVELYENEIQIL